MNHAATIFGIAQLRTGSSDNDIECYFVSADNLHFLNPTLSVVRIQEIVDMATTELFSKSIEAIVNLRTEEAFRQRQAGGAPPNHGQIAVQAAVDYAANPQKLRRGKIVLARVRSLLQEEMGANPRVYFPSEFLREPNLSVIAKAIWNENAVDGASSQGAEIIVH